MCVKSSKKIKRVSKCIYLNELNAYSEPPTTTVIIITTATMKYNNNNMLARNKHNRKDDIFTSINR